MVNQANSLSAIKIETGPEIQGFEIARGEDSAWQSDFELTVRSLGRRVVCELRNQFPLGMTDERVVNIGANLASQEPPLPIELSWKFYDGIRDALEDERSSTRYRAQEEQVLSEIERMRQQ